VLVDSHCHLNYLDDPHERLAEARRRQVGAFLCIGVDQGTSRDVLALAQQYPDVWATAGQHPEGITGPCGLDWIMPLARATRRIVAVGETGLDYFRLDATDAARQVQRWQCDAFAAQLAIAAELELPAVVHTRAADDDTIAIIRNQPRVTGVLHCFTESWTLASAALELGWYVSISGIVTFRNADNVRAIAVQVPADRLLVETDSPWLAPVPHRGQVNEPAFVVDTAHYVAELRRVPFEVLAAQTTENFYRLFTGARLAGPHTTRTG
jgi:TatD DNase family protein